MTKLFLTVAALTLLAFSTWSAEQEENPARGNATITATKKPFAQGKNFELSIVQKITGVFRRSSPNDSPPHHDRHAEHCSTYQNLSAHEKELIPKILDRIIKEKLTEVGLLKIHPHLCGKSSAVCDEIIHRLPESMQIEGRKWPTAYKLSLSYTQITDEGVERLLKTLSHFPGTITEIYLNHCPNLTPQKKASFSQEKNVQLLS